MATQAALVPDRISFEEFLTAYDGVRAEWVDGQVVEMSPTSDRHADISDFLITVLRVLVASTRAGVVRSSQVAMRIGPVARVPDLLFLKAEHADRLTPSHVEGAADLAIESVSPDSRDRDRTQKFREYEQAGVTEYWIVDPLRETVELYRMDAQGRYVRVPAQGDPPRLASAVLPRFWLDPRWLWSSPMPDPMVVFREWGLI
ncbi:MAG TPA: Uma2 family endonuclease [Longimicrobium sp.]|nr:Uma2 family endonuclease [Longimicrobium sp.]